MSREALCTSGKFGRISLAWVCFNPELLCELLCVPAQYTEPGWPKIQVSGIRLANTRPNTHACRWWVLTRFSRFCHIYKQPRWLNSCSISSFFRLGCRACNAWLGSWRLVFCDFSRHLWRDDVRRNMCHFPFNAEAFC